MAYSVEHREALGFLITDLLQLHNRHMSLHEINMDVLKMKGRCSHFTEKDDDFKKEWGAIQKDRAHLVKVAGYRQGQEGCEEEDLAFRLREMEALERAANRAGVLSRKPIPVTTWEPKMEIAA